MKGQFALFWLMLASAGLWGAGLGWAPYLTGALFIAFTLTMGN